MTDETMNRADAVAAAQLIADGLDIDWPAGKIVEYINEQIVELGVPESWLPTILGAMDDAFTDIVLEEERGDRMAALVETVRERWAVVMKHREVNEEIVEKLRRGEPIPLTVVMEDGGEEIDLDSFGWTAEEYDALRGFLAAFDACEKEAAQLPRSSNVLAHYRETVGDPQMVEHAKYLHGLTAAMREVLKHEETQARELERAHRLAARRAHRPTPTEPDVKCARCHRKPRRVDDLCKVCARETGTLVHGKIGEG